jgi:mono/diheme cytochrome c family protein
MPNWPNWLSRVNRLNRLTPATLVFCCVYFFSQVLAQTHLQVAENESRGSLLYNTHCISCHTTQMHWRADRQARDWDSLQFQVRRWQGNAGLQWSDADIIEVSRYLNETIYRYPLQVSLDAACRAPWSPRRG